jgi:hypothetical protein
VEDERVLIYDTPGLFETDGVEMDIANGLGLIREIRKAKSVKPAVIISRDGMGDRFQAVSELLDTLTRMLGNSPEVDLKPLSYAFTKYENKYRHRLCKQFETKLDQMSQDDKKSPLLVSLVSDIIAKTTP